MSLELIRYYEAPRGGQPFTGSAYTSIPSLGTYYDNRRIPDLLLTVYYTADPKTGFLVKGDKDKLYKFVIQPDGPSEAELDSPPESLKIDFTGGTTCKFEFRLNVLFGVGVTDKVGISIGGSLEGEKGVKGGLEVGYERSQEKPGVRTTIQLLFKGVLSAQMRQIGILSSELLGSTRNHPYEKPWYKSGN